MAAGVLGHPGELHWTNWMKTNHHSGCAWKYAAARCDPTRPPQTPTLVVVGIGAAVAVLEQHCHALDYGMDDACCKVVVVKDAGEAQCAVGENRDAVVDDGQGLAKAHKDDVGTHNAGHVESGVVMKS